MRDAPAQLGAFAQSAVLGEPPASAIPCRLDVGDHLRNLLANCRQGQPHPPPQQEMPGTPVGMFPSNAEPDERVAACAPPPRPLCGLWGNPLRSLCIWCLGSLDELPQGRCLPERVAHRLPD